MIFFAENMIQNNTIHHHGKGCFNKNSIDTGAQQQLKNLNLGRRMKMKKMAVN